MKKIDTTLLKEAIEKEILSLGSPEDKLFIETALVSIIDNLLFKEFRQFFKENKNLVKCLAEDNSANTKEYNEYVKFLIKKFTYRINKIELIKN
jgi:hypothetical protein